MLISDEEAAKHIRIDDDADDVSLYVRAAEDYAKEFIGRNIYADQKLLDEAVAAGEAGDEPMVIKSAVKAAILLIAADLYANREDGIESLSKSVYKRSQYLMLPYKNNWGA